MKIAIVTRSDDRSPKVLAAGLESMLIDAGIGCTVFYETGTLIRLQPLSQKLKFPYSILKRIYGKLKFYIHDRRFFNELKRYDLVIICECSPNGFWKGYYAIEQLRAMLKKPILFYEVYYLGNTPTQIARLKADKDPAFERYDWHLAVTDVTEIKSEPGNGWTRIGLSLDKTGLKPVSKSKFLVIVDFEQPGYEHFRAEQISVLKELDIDFIALEGNYNLNEIREIYKRACLLFIQFPEAFGLPIAECLSTGAFIGTPSSSWPMSWRLDQNPQVHSEGTLPDFFLLYNTVGELKDLLLKLKANYRLSESPYVVFNDFVNQYPHYYYGDKDALKLVLHRLIVGKQERK